VIAAIAQTYAFNYNEFIDLTKSPRALLPSLTKILNMKEVLADAKNSFVEEEEEYEKPLKDFQCIDSDDDERMSPVIKKKDKRYYSV